MNTEDSLTYAAAKNQLDNGNTNAALTAFNNYLDKFPDGVYFLDANFNAAEIDYAKKDWKTALVGYEDIAANAPNKYAEKAVLNAARIYFFDAKDYGKAEKYYQQLKDLASNNENRLEAMRGLLRSQYQLQKWSEALANAKDLSDAKGSNADDKLLASMTMAKSYEVNGQYDQAISNFKQVVDNNKAALAAEARYEIAACWFAVNRLSDAEKAAFETIKKSGSYDLWVGKSYILLGDIYFKQKDYFNAKATYQSIINNTINNDLKSEAQTKLNKVLDEESSNSKVNN
jgi:TolA-binding protein